MSDKTKQSNEQLYFDALKRILKYQTPDQLQRGSEKSWGLPYEEAIGYAYENIQQEARNATRGKRRPQS